MDGRTYTELEIAKTGFKEFKISGDNSAFRKQISAVIKRKDIKPVGMKKSTPTAKREAKAYSETDKDVVISELSDYLREQSSDSVIKKYKSNGEYQKIAEEYNKNYDDMLLEQVKSEAFYMEHGYFEGEQDGISDDVNRIKNKMIIEALSKVYIEKQAQNNPQEALQNSERLTNVFRSPIIREKLFLALYDFRVDELTRDLYKSKEISQNKFDDLTKEDMRFFDKLANWENYVSCKVRKTKS